MSIELKVPDAGESITEAQIAEWLKAAGETVERDEPVAVLETDKATQELPAPVSGTITELLKEEGDTVEVGEVIGYMKEGIEEASAEEEPAADGESKAKARNKKAQKKKRKGKAKRKGTAAEGEEEPAEEEEEDGAAEDDAAEDGAGEKEEEDGAAEDGEETPAPKRRARAQRTEAEGQRRGGESHASPAVRRLLAEHGLSAGDVEASGRGGRLLKRDVLRHLRELEEGDGDGREGEEVSSARESDRNEELVPMSPLRRRIAERLVEATQQAALLTTFNEIDMSRVIELRRSLAERFRERYDVKLGFMSFFVKAVVEALKDFPRLNAEVRGTKVAYRHYYDIGVAIGGGKGLVVPVLENAERMSFAEIEVSIDDFARRAVSNDLRLEELQGGTFTISNGGVYGSLLSTPIVNPPQSGILGLHAIQERPVARDGEIVLRPMMYAAVTYDHRIVDGRESVSFLKRIKETIEEPSRLLLEV